MKKTTQEPYENLTCEEKRNLRIHDIEERRKEAEKLQAEVKKEREEKLKRLKVNATKSAKTNLGNSDTIEIQPTGQTQQGGFEGGQYANATTGGAIGKWTHTQDGGAIGSIAVSTTGGAVGDLALTNNGGAVGRWSDTSAGGAVGNLTQATTGGAVGDRAFADTGGAVGRWADTSAGGAVGNSAASGWGGAVGENASADSGGAIGQFASATEGGAVGWDTRATTGGAIGEGARATSGFSGGADARGTVDAIQLGTGINSTPNTLQIYNHRLMNADGKIPMERLPNGIGSGKRYASLVIGSTVNYNANELDLVWNSASDVTAIQTALNQLSARGGAEVLLLDGIYSIVSNTTPALVIPHNITVRGTGGATVINVQFTGSQSAEFMGVVRVDGVIRDLRANINSANGGALETGGTTENLSGTGTLSLTNNGVVRNCTGFNMIGAESGGNTSVIDCKANSFLF